jgi:hypothetical protein
MKIDKCPLTLDEKNNMVMETAYYKSKNHSLGDTPMDDWLAAEAEIEGAMAESCQPISRGDKR